MSAHIKNYNYKNDRCTLISTTGEQYRKISDVPITEYFSIHTIKDIPVQFLKCDKYFSKIEPFLNLSLVWSLRYLIIL